MAARRPAAALWTLGTLLSAACRCLAAQQQQQQAAISLESTDGQRLDFLRLTVGAALVGPFAFVENELVFQNPEPRRMEGRFSFALPSGPGGPAAPSRFAMEIQGRLMEGEVVNRSKARRVYREILHEARDPALLEQGQGNIFTARVFPIEARAVVRLLLSYSLTVPLRSMRRALVLPLSGLPYIGEFAFSAVVGSLGGAAVNASCSLPHFGAVNASGGGGGDGLVRFAADTSQGLVPEADVVLEAWERPSAGTTISVGGGHLVSLFKVGDSATPVAAPPLFSPSAWIVYVDTSASTADTAVVRVPLIAALLDAMPQADVEVWAFDIEVVQLRGRGPKDGALGSDIRSALESRMPLGATDLELLLRHVDSHAQAAGGALGVLILSDAIPTASERGAAQLGRLLADRAGRVVELGVLGSKFDSSAGTAIAASGNGRIVQIPLTSSDLTAVAVAAWADLTRPLGSRASPQVTSGWVWPQAICDLHAGDEAIVYSGGGGGLTVPRPELELVKDNASTTLVPGATQAAAAAFSALLAREATRARLELLEAQRQLAASASEAQALEDDIVRLSERDRVLSPHTALLVLETEQDYVRFGIARDQLSPILVATASGVELRSRAEIALPALPTTVTTTEGTTTTQTTTTTTTASSADPSGDSQNDLLPPAPGPPDPQGQYAEYAGGTTAGGTTARSGRPGGLALLAVVLSMLWGACAAEAEGCGGAGEEECGSLRGGYGGGGGGAAARRLGWANLNVEAAATVGKYGDGGPQERRRDVATKYAGALWTLRRAQDLRNFTARWLTWDPANTLVFEYISKAAQQLGDETTALRAATSVAEVSPRDSEQLLRGAWIAITLNSAGSPDWARRFAERSLEERQDNPNTYRALALANWRGGDFPAAARAYERGLAASFHGRYGDVGRVLREEAALMLRSLQASNASMAESLRRDVLKAVDPNTGSDISLLITLSWLTDANDVDLHVVEPNGEECYFSNRRTRQLELYSDQTQGLGPEVVALRGSPQAGTYRVGVKYYSSGSMGASRGAVVIRRMQSGMPMGQARVEVFTLPAGYSDVLPVAEVKV